MTAKSYKTAKGTELPLLNLRGKQYLEVKFRLVWFREDHPDWSIETELMAVTDNSAYARATIKDESGRIIATSHKFENVKGFPDFIEKAETGSIGRALALIGYGTQFCADELDEGHRIVDAPVQSRKPNMNFKAEVDQKSASEVTSINVQSAREGQAAEEDTTESFQDAGHMTADPKDYTINFGRKYKGRKLSEIPRKEIEGYISWLEGSAAKDGTILSQQVRYLKDAFDRMYSSEETAASH